MATFTMQLREAYEQMSGDIGLSDYPIHDESYRGTLNRKIVRHYWHHEIGQETPDLFRWMLAARMNEIMPYFVQLYKTNDLDYDPMSTVDMTTTTASDSASDTQAEGASDSASGSGSASRGVNSEFPQTMLSEDGDYATNATDSTSASDSTASASETNASQVASTSTGETTQRGRSQSGALLLQAHRDTIINIDIQIIDAISDLFMHVWDIDSPYSEG